MSESRAGQITMVSRPVGVPTPANFRLEETAVPALLPGGLLLRVLYLSLDPYMRGRMDDRKSYTKPIAVGDVMPGESVCQVLASDRAAYVAGDIVLAHTGWRSHAAWEGPNPRKLDPGAAPITTGLGVLGMPGFTAYSGLHVIGMPQPGETVVVAAASGPVGSLVGQLARVAGARAVGIAGGEQKCRYILEELGFDAAVDHRDPAFKPQLASACPKGVDVYFENVGGAVWQAVLPLLNTYARVPVCGLIAQYNAVGPGTEANMLPATMRAILTRSLTVRGFISSEFAGGHYSAFLKTVTAGVAAGRIRYREDITDGLENAPAAFIRMLEGSNFGKALVRVGR